MPFLEQFDDSRVATFRKRVAVAIVKTAVAVANETKPTATAPEAERARYASRRSLATSILNNTETHVPAFCLALVSGGVVTSTSTDAVIETNVNTLFDPMAGVEKVSLV